MRKVIHYSVVGLHNLEETSSTPLNTGIHKAQRFLAGLGRFGATPFIYPMFGIGELSQAFTRLCGVYGGVYILNQDFDLVKKERAIDKQGLGSDEEFEVELNLDMDGQASTEMVQGSTIVVSPEYLPPQWSSVQDTLVHRCVLFTSHSLFEDAQSGILTIPPSAQHAQAVHVFQFDHETGACKEGEFVLHFSTVCGEGEEDYLEVRFICG